MARTKYPNSRNARAFNNARTRKSFGMRPGRAGTIRRTDGMGGTYGGSIFSLRLNDNQPFSKRPERGIRGANFSTSQMINVININSGVTNGSATGLPYITVAAGANTYFSMAFSLQDLAQVAALTGIFDQYRFDKVELKFVPQSTGINVMNTAAPNDNVPSLFVVLDFDDATAPASLAAVQQYDNVQSCQYGQGLMVTLEPSETPAVYASGAFSGYSVRKAGWQDCASTTIGHYGVKGCITELTVASTSEVFWNVHAKYFVSFRNTR